MTAKDTLIEFPCDFPIKIIGVNSESFKDDILAITLKHFPHFAKESMTAKMSQQNNYLAITTTVPVQNQQQLDDYYKEVSIHPQIKMVL